MTNNTDPLKVIVIYHGNCADGFSAAWVCRRYFESVRTDLSRPLEVEYHPGVYQKEPPDVKGKIVYLVDFSYKRPVVEQMIKDADTVFILDHHKTAIEDLQGLEGLTSVFDLEHSGAMITWNYFFPNKEPPMLLKHVEDRDLWKFKLQGTREIQAALFSYEYTFENWDRLMDVEKHLDEELSILGMYRQGQAIERKHFKDINELIKVLKRPMKVAGYTLNVVNLPYTMSSDAGHILCEQGEPFGCCYYDKPEGREFSLRSEGDKVDVSVIARSYGGGGHKNAAGFRVSHKQAKTMEIE